MATMSASISGVSPISRIAASTYMRGLAAVERGDFDQVLRQFGPRCELVFVSRTALGARLSGRADLLRWFERFRRLLPDPQFDVLRFVVGGPVWDQRIAAHVIIRSRIVGDPYQNQFAQFLTLRWGKVVEDLILEDTATWETASRRLAAAGDAEAAEPPLAPNPSVRPHLPSRASGRLKPSLLPYAGLLMSGSVVADSGVRGQAGEQCGGPATRPAAAPPMSVTERDDGFRDA